jgi:hypothetical protein
MGIRVSTTLDIIAGYENSLDNKLFGGDSVLAELIDTLDHGESGVYALDAGEQNVAIDFGDVTEARLVYLEGDGEFEVVFGGAVATAAQITGSGGTYPTGFTGGETLNITIDGTPIAVVFDAADQSLVQVLARVNYFAALLSLPPVAFDSGGELQLKSPTTGLTSTVAVVSGTAMATLGLAPAAATGANAAPGTSNLAISRPADPGGASAAEGVKAYLLATIVATSIILTNPSATAGVRIKTLVVGDLLTD